MVAHVGMVLLTLILFAFGFFGVFIPFLPGVPLAWLGLFLYAFFTHFATISLTTVLVFLGVTILTLILDFVAPILGAKRNHATKYGIIGASLGFLIGIFVLGPLGIIAGPFLGAFAGEFFAGKKSGAALDSAIGTLKGFVLGMIFKVTAILVMLGFFVVALFR